MARQDTKWDPPAHRHRPYPFSISLSISESIDSLRWLVRERC